MKKTKILSLALLLCVAVMVIGVLASCGTPAETVCEHTNVEAIGEAKAPTCTEVGLTEGKKCADCGKIIEEQEEIIPVAHTEVAVDGKLATCIEEGLTDGVICSVCGEIIISQDPIPKASHFPASAVKENEVAPNCTEAGKYDKVAYCIVCNGEVSRTEVTIPATSHSYDNEFDKNCNTCGFVRDINCPHANKVAIGVAKAATCTEDGITAGEQCNDCKDILTPQEIITAKGHTEVVDAAVAATCTTTGKTEGKHCSVCHEILIAQTEIAASGHTNAAVVKENEKAPDCINAGSYDNVIYCSVCKVEISRDTVTVDALGHTEVIDTAVAATCTNAGKTEGKHCSVCHEVLVAQTVIDAKGHYYDDDQDETCNNCDFVRDVACIHTNLVAIGEAKDPTCTETGITAGEKCAKCDEIITAQEVIPANGHTEVTDVAVAATCSATGLTEGKHCSVCNTVIVAQEIVGKLPHTEVIDAAIEPTCTVAGKTEGKHCSVCQEVLVAQNEITANGHTNAEAVKENESAPDCDTAGSYDLVIYCTVCKAEVSRETKTIDALGHTYNTWSVTTVPTYTTEGAATSGNISCPTCNAEVSAITKVLPIVSESNGYTKVSSGVVSTWNYVIDGENVSVKVEETEGVNSYRYDVNESSDPANEQNENNPFIASNGGSRSDTDGAYRIEGGKYAYGAGNNAILTVTIYVDEATTVNFKLISDSRAGAGIFGYYPANGVGGSNNPYIKSLTLNGSTDGITPSTKTYPTKGWNNFQDCELAILNLKAGPNVVSFQIGGDNINYAGIVVDSVLPVSLTTTYKFTLDTVTKEETADDGSVTKVYEADHTNDPFVAENGGSTSEAANLGIESNVYRYGNGNEAILTTTIYVEKATIVTFNLINDCRAGSGIFGYYPADGVGGSNYPYIKSLTLNGSTDGVTPSTKTYPTKGWNKFMECELATLELKAGANVVTLEIAGDNVNYIGISVVSSKEAPVSIAHLANEDVYRVTSDTSNPFDASNGGDADGLNVVSTGNGKYYEASYGKTFTITVNVEKKTVVNFYILTTTRFSGITRQASVSDISLYDANGNKIDGAVHRISAPVTNIGGWNTANATKELFAIIELQEGTNVITFTREATIQNANNFNIAGIAFASNGKVSLGAAAEE